MRVLALAALLISASVALAQPTHQRRGHSGGPVLFMGRADAAKVVPRQTSTATATAAIIIDRVAQELRFDLTYQGLERSPPSRIALYNYGVSGNGPLVADLCGGGAEPCPGRPSARLAGTAANLRLPGRLLVEFASGRIYLQIHGADGKPEIRAQLDANDAMVEHRDFVARLTPGPARGASGEGTAILTETYLPGDRVAVEYSVTVAGTSGAPEAAALVGLAASADVTTARFSRPGRLLNVRRTIGRTAPRGGTFDGSYVTKRGSRAPVVQALIEQARTPAVAVRTSRFPNGELVGVFVPVE